MTMHFAKAAPCLQMDALAQWLDEVGVPVMLAGAVATMIATLAG